MRDDDLIKYPRTPHLEGSRLQDGDTEDGRLSFSSLRGKYLVLEEKMDGANSGISFSESAELRLQSRGHFLTGGAREKHFNLLKEWATCQQDALFSLLGSDHVMYGEWMYAKHSMFYNRLPHFFLEFDIYHKPSGRFYSTEKRKQMLLGSPVVSVPILWSGVFSGDPDVFSDHIGYSVGRTSNFLDDLNNQAKKLGLDHGRLLGQTDQHVASEGLYLKIEEGDFVVGRGKYVRSSFTQTLLDQGEHWQKRPIVSNMLRDGQNIYAPTISSTWEPFLPIPSSKKMKKGA